MPLIVGVGVDNSSHRRCQYFVLSCVRLVSGRRCSASGHPGPLFFVNLIILLKCNLIISLWRLILSKRPNVERHMDLVSDNKTKKKGHWDCCNSCWF